MPDIYSDMTGPAAPEQTTLRKQCSQSQVSASLELRREKGKGDLQGQPQKPEGCQGAETYSLMSGSHRETLGICTAPGLTGSKTQLPEINTHTHTLSLFINIYIFIAVAMGF